MKLKNLIRALADQGPPKRFIRNFFITRNAWGLFHQNSHIAAGSGKEKVKFNTKSSALKSAESLGKKRGVHYSVYKCIFCDGFHMGRNRDNKQPVA